MASAVSHCIFGPLCRASIDSHIRLATVHRVALVDMPDLLISFWDVVNFVVKFIVCNKFLLCPFCHIIFALTDLLIVILSEHMLGVVLFLKHSIWTINDLRNCVFIPCCPIDLIVHESVAQWLRPLLSP